MVLYFPQLHPDLLSPAWREVLPTDVRFLDPGLGKAGSPEHLRPEAAPFDPRMARALLADTLRYGESVANPRDILAQSLIEQAGVLSAESSRAVLAEVEQSVSGAAQPVADAGEALLNARKQGQMLLLLAWNLEERLLDLRGIEEGLRTASDRLGQSVAAGEGVVDDESDHEALALGRELSGITLPMHGGEALPWRKLLESFAVLVPGVALCTLDLEIAEALAESGVPEDSLDHMPGARRVFRAQAWRLMGQDRLPAARPWLNAMLTLGVFALDVEKGQGA